MKQFLLGIALFLAGLAGANAQPANTNITGCVYFVTPPAVADKNYATTLCDNTGAPIAGVGSRTNTNLSSTIAVTNTFQSIQVATATRKGCSVQNTGSNSMWVFFGPIASATKATSLTLAVGQSALCSTGGTGMLTDQISITGTAGDAFYAGVQ